MHEFSVVIDLRDVMREKPHTPQLVGWKRFIIPFGHVCVGKFIITLPLLQDKLLKRKYCENAFFGSPET
jgi:hypothetical protein